MILGAPDNGGAAAPPPQGRSQVANHQVANHQVADNNVTIDDIFRGAARRRPDALALADAPNRTAFTDGEPRRLSFAEADRAVSAIAARLQHMDLPAGAVIGVQLPNIAENVLTLLAIVRAGMIAAPLPLLWRRADAAAALNRVGAKALIASGRVGTFNPCQAALPVAADVFSICYVCGFGADLPDGVVSFDDLLAGQAPEAVAPPERERQDHAAANVAAVTFDVGAGGIVPVARNHRELLAGGLGVVLESRLARDAVILATLPPASFAGICLTLLPWLICGGTLLLHHPFDARVLARQWRDTARHTALIVPEAIAFRLAEAGLLAGDAPGVVLAAWRAPERLAASRAWRERDVGLVDVAIFGEAGLVAGRRGADGRPAPLPSGPIAAPRGDRGAVLVAELLQGPRGTATLRGPMLPHHAFPPGADRAGLAHLALGSDGAVDTGCGCRIDHVTATATITAAPAGIVSAGGCRMPLRALQDLVGRIDARATLTALPDPLLGQRLIGNAEHRDAVQAALAAAGANPLVVAAFADRSGRDEAPVPSAATVR